MLPWFKRFSNYIAEAAATVVALQELTPERKNCQKSCFFFLILCAITCINKLKDQSVDMQPSILERGEKEDTKQWHFFLQSLVAVCLMMFLGQGVRENIQGQKNYRCRPQISAYVFQVSRRQKKKKQEKIKIKYMLIKDAKPADLVEFSLGNLFSGFIDK